MATVRIPNSDALRKTRVAISLRFAANNLRIGRMVESEVEEELAGVGDFDMASWQLSDDQKHGRNPVATKIPAKPVICHATNLRQMCCDDADCEVRQGGQSREERFRKCSKNA